MVRLLSSVLLVAALAACPLSEESLDEPDASSPGLDASAPVPDAGSACPAPGAGTRHDGAEIKTDTTWRAVDGPHLVTYTTRIAKGATLTLEPCTQVLFDGVHGLDVDGTLVARGSETRPITFARAKAGTAWSFLYSSGGTIDLAWATLTGGGSAQSSNGVGAIEVRGDPALPRRAALRVQHVTVDGSEMHGVSLRGNAGFAADSTALTVRNAAKSAVRAAPHLAQDLPTGVYAGNGADEVLVIAEGNLLEDTTWRDRGVPYRVGDEAGNGKVLPIGSTALPAVRAQLTLEAGVVVKVTPTGRIQLSKAGVPPVTTGALAAQGSATKPVVFTSAKPSPAAGDWVGIVLDHVPDPADKLDHVRIEYAGGASGANGFHCSLSSSPNEGDVGGLLVFGQPSQSFVTNSVFADLDGYGVDLAYSGTSVDFMAANTFERVAKCRQSTPRNSEGNCPATVVCP